MGGVTSLAMLVDRLMVILSRPEFLPACVEMAEWMTNIAEMI